MTDGIFPQLLRKGEKPFFGVYYEYNKDSDPDRLSLANACVLATLRTNDYHTDAKTLDQALKRNTFENKDKFIYGSVVMPQYRMKE